MKRAIFLGLVLGVLVLELATPAPADVVQSPSPGPVRLPAPPLTNAPASLALPAPAVAQSTSDAAEDIRDIRGPISIPYEWLWTLYVAAALAFLAALYAGWRFFRRRAVAKMKSPDEIALEKLEAARVFMTPATVRDYAFTTSEIIRVYIEQRFGEKAAHRTTEEFLNDLLAQTGTPLAAHRRRLEDFLGHCDLSKFARWQFTEREMESMHASARDFILETKSQPESNHASPQASGTASTQLATVK